MKDFATWQGLCTAFPGGIRLVQVVHSFRERREYLKGVSHRDLPTWKLRDGLVLLFVPLEVKELHAWLAKVGE